MRTSRAAPRSCMHNALLTQDPNTLVLQDPGVSSSPLEKRIGFLQSKNLTQEEIDTALARAGEGSSAFSPSSTASSPTPGSPNYGYPNQQATRQPADVRGGYQGGYWPPQPPPESVYILLWPSPTARSGLANDIDLGRQRGTGEIGLSWQL